MKLPNRIIIDLDDNGIILETDDGDIVSNDVQKLYYCQNVSGEGIDISINISIPSTKIERRENKEEDMSQEDCNLYDGQLRLNMDDTLVKFVKGLVNEQSYEDEEQNNTTELDYNYIQNLFDKASSPPYSDDKMKEFIDYSVQGHDNEIFEYKKALFLDALKDPNISNKKRVWLKKNKINLLNSNCKLNKND